LKTGSNTLLEKVTIRTAENRDFVGFVASSHRTLWRLEKACKVVTSEEDSAFVIAELASIKSGVRVQPAPFPHSSRSETEMYARLLNPDWVRRPTVRTLLREWRPPYPNRCNPHYCRRERSGQYDCSPWPQSHDVTI